jgi:antitoxin component YwqK of YwqJK toxin-antitoxin module
MPEARTSSMRIGESADDGPANTPSRKVVDEEPQGLGLHDGVWIHRDPAGRALARGAYRQGQRQGLWVRYFEPGEGAMFATEEFREFEPPFTSEAEFKDGLLHGKWTVYDAERRIASQWEFCDNVAHGTASLFFPEGTLRQHSSFQHGRLDGEHTVWDAQHQVVEKLQYACGLRITSHEEFYVPRVTLCTGGHVDTRERIEASFNWWQGIAGTVSIRGQQREVKHGLWTWRYESGQELLEGTYEDGRPTGTFTWWFENGQCQLMGAYVDGQPSGEFVWWHPNGQKHMSVPYVGGRQSGPWMRWDAEGAVAQKGDVTIDPLTEFLAGGAPTTTPVQAALRTASRLKNKPDSVSDAQPRPTLATPPDVLLQPIPPAEDIGTSNARAHR